MVVLQAAACGVTTVVTAVGILPEIVPPEQIVPVGDEEAVALAITSVLGDPVRRRALEGGWGRFSLAQCLEDLAHIYREVIHPAEFFPKKGRSF